MRLTLSGNSDGLLKPNHLPKGNPLDFPVPQQKTGIHRLRSMETVVKLLSKLTCDAV
jgi:hypothetical protein